MKLYADFDERGYHVEAYLPTNAKEPQEWVVKAHKDGELVKEIHVPMFIAPRFGPDSNDVRKLEEETDKLMKSLP